MDDQRLVEELMALLEAAGVKIRTEPLGGGGGGLCCIRGEHLLFLDAQAGSAERAAACAEAVAGLVDIEQLYIRPQVRQFIEDNTPQSRQRSTSNE